MFQFVLAVLAGCHGAQSGPGLQPAPEVGLSVCPPDSHLHFPSRDVEACVDDQGALHGMWRHFHPDGSLAMEGSYEAGEKSGAWKSLRPDGVLEWEEEYGAPGELAARWEYGVDGELRASLRFEGGRRHGRATWFFADGSPREQVSFEHGKRHGRELAWSEEGNLERSGSWRFDRRDGPWQYTLDGDLGASEVWLDGSLVEASGPVPAELGTLDCPAHTFAVRVEHAGGSTEHCQTPAGTLHGPGEARFADGSLRRVGSWRAGEPDGAFQTWCTNGMPMSQGSYVAGEQVGAWSRWSCQGALVESVVHGEVAAR
ncbi:MAG: hypothetical protein VX899_10060 [Myxococcota bacterium]|nr:hypothetical protein [Myxococcota bacterium]